MGFLFGLLIINWIIFWIFLIVHVIWKFFWFSKKIITWSTSGHFCLFISNLYTFFSYFIPWVRNSRPMSRSRMIVGILVFFLILMEMLLKFHHLYWYLLSVFHRFTSLGRSCLAHTFCAPLKPSPCLWQVKRPWVPQTSRAEVRRTKDNVWANGLRHLK